MPDIFASEDVDLKKLLNAEDRDLIGRMKSILGPFILRRLKSDVMQQLVPKIQQVCLLPLVQIFLFYYALNRHYVLVSICQFLLLQVEYVIMERQQESAYKEAIEEYRAVSQARMAKCSELNSKNLLAVLPRRQINNYFVQFRKVPDLCFDLK